MDYHTQAHKQKLEGMLVEITKELEGIGIHDPRNPSDWIAVPEGLDAEEPDENISADSVESWDERQGLVATLEPQYNAIVSALARIEAGTFGKCEVCGQSIEEARLTVNPTSRTCVLHREEVLP